VRINDHGPFVRRRCIDVSHAASRAIGMGGLARVTVE
jgi:rare lipoprotein A